MTNSSVLKIPGIEQPKYEVLATQGPQFSTSFSFWKDLVLNKQCHIVVNLCTTIGKTQKSGYGANCDQYWPLDGKLSFNYGE